MLWLPCTNSWKTAFFSYRLLKLLKNSVALGIPRPLLSHCCYLQWFTKGQILCLIYSLYFIFVMHHRIQHSVEQRSNKYEINVMVQLNNRLDLVLSTNDTTCGQTKQS